jgi:hypothetical protein
MLSEIKLELRRLGATQAKVVLDGDFEPSAGELVKIEFGGAYWHMLPDQFRALLADLPDGAGSEAIRRTIEEKGPMVWHGPAPENSREGTP